MLYFMQNMVLKHFLVYLPTAFFLVLVNTGFLSCSSDKIGSGAVPYQGPPPVPPPDTSDLTLEGPVNVSYHVAMPNQSIDVSVSVHFTGTAISGSGSVSYYRSTSTPITGGNGNTKVGSDDFTVLAANGSIPTTVNINVPNVPGTYYYGACIDGTTVCKTGPSIIVTTIPTPSLVLENLRDLPLTAEMNVPITIKVDVRNKGTDTSGSGEVKYYQSDDSVIDSTDTEVAKSPFNGIPAPGTSTVTANPSPNTPSVPGTYFYGVCISGTAVCTAGTSVTVTGVSNLILEGSVNVSPQAAVPNDPIDVSVTVKNTGTAISSNGAVSYYRSVNTPVTSNDTKVGSDDFTALAANGGAASTTVRTNAPGVGTYFYGACIDGTTVCKTGPSVIVTGVPNLVLEDPVGVSPLTAVPNDPIDVSVTVKNTGTAISSNGAVSYYRSVNTPISSGDTKVGSATFTALAANGGAASTTVRTNAQGVGTYYYGACIDGTAVCKTGPSVTVTAAPTPNLVLEAPVNVSPLTAVPNDPIDVSVTVKNTGTAISSNGAVSYYRSTSTPVTSSDTGVGSATFTALAANGGAASTTVRTNAPGVGTYYYGACIDGTAVCKTGPSVTVTAAPTPNLVLEDPVNVSPLTAVPNDPIDVSVTVKNTGTAISSNGAVSYYRSVNTPISSGDTKVGSATFTALAANGGAASTTVRTNAQGVGTYYYGACIDGTAVCKTGPIVTVTAAPTPNLVLEDPVNVSPLTAVPNDPIDVSVTVKNTGTAISSNGAVSYYRSVNTPISSGDTKVGSATFTALAANGGAASTTVRTNAQGVGTYYYGACIDGTAVCKTGPIVTVTAAPTPNLVLEGPVNVSTQTAVPNERIDVSVSVKNMGLTVSNSGTVSYYRSTNTPITGGSGETGVGSDSFTALAANGSDSTTVRTNAPGVGTYYYGACIDGTAVCKTGPIVTVTAAPTPNLVLEGPVGVSPLAAMPNDSIDVSVTVKNTGTAISSNGAVSYYRSTNTPITGGSGETGVGSDSFTALAVNGSDSTTVRTNAPGVGTYFYGACIDGTTVCKTGPSVTVTAAPTPNLVLEGSVNVSPLTAVPNDPIDVSVTVKNTGTAISSNGAVSYYRSTNTPITGGSGETGVGSDSFTALAANGGAVSTTVRTNAPGVGTYFYGACIDGTTVCKTGPSVTVTAAPTPNLVLEGSVNVSPLTAVPNDPIDVSVTVKNTGTAISSNGAVSYYRSTNTPITGGSGETGVGSDSFTALAANGGAVSTTVRTNAQGVGTYYYGACIDGTTVCKTGPSVIVTAAPTPNLVLEGSVNVSPLTAVPNDPIDVSVTVKNTGTAISSNGAVSYYRSTNTPITGGSGETGVGSDSFTALAANGGAVSTTVRTNAPGVGTYYYGACIDGTAVCKTGPIVTVTAAPTPNLVLEGPVGVSPLTAMPNDSIDVSVTVKNTGTAISSNGAVSYYRSTNTPITGGSGETGVGSDSFTALAANGGAVSTTVRTNAPGVGTYYYGACIDGTAVCKTGPIVTVTAAPTPNLVLEGPVGVSPLAAMPNDSIDVSVTVKNTGTAISSNGAVSYYRSTNTPITGGSGETGVGSDSFTAIAVNGSDSTTVRTNAPGVGTYYYGACIDGTAVCKTGPIVTVTATPTPNLVLEGPVGVSPLTAVPNDPIDVSVTVKNTGTAISSNGAVSYYRSTNTPITGGSGETGVGSDSFTALAVNGSDSTTVRTNAPGVGTYYYGACIDGTTVCKTGPSVIVTAAPTPNLVLEDPVNVSPLTAVPNDPIDVSVTVKNTGTAISSNGAVSYYRSVNTPISSGDTKVGSATFTALAANGGAASTTVRTNAPGVGTYYYGACIDGTAVCKTGPSVTVTAAPTPNLVLEDPVNVSPLTAVPNDPIDVSVTVKNTGTAISSNGAVSYYRSVNTPISSGDTKVGSATFTALAANGGAASTTVRTNAQGVGTYYYGACIDGTAVCKTGPIVTVTAAPTPNLVLEGPVNVSPLTAVPNDPIDVSVTVKNTGTAISSNGAVSYYRSVNTPISSGDTKVGSATFTALAANGGAASTTVRTNAQGVGTYYYGACIDGTAVCKTGPIVTVTAAPTPNLVLEDPVNVSPLTAVPNDPIDVSVTVKNTGTAISSNGAVSYYRSTNTPITGGSGETGVGSDSFTALAVNGSDSTTVRTNAPGVGTYYYGACIDGTAVCKTGPIVTVTAAPTPNLVLEDPVNVSPLTAVPNDPIDVSVTVKNTGISSNGAVSYYRSTTLQLPAAVVRRESVQILHCHSRKRVGFYDCQNQCTRRRHILLRSLHRRYRCMQNGAKRYSNRRSHS